MIIQQFLTMRLGVGPQQASRAVAGPYDGATLDFNPANEDLGAMGAVANAGSVVCDITQASTGIVIDDDGPNLTHYAKNPNASFADYLTVVGKTMADFVSAGSGMIGMAFKSDVTETWMLDSASKVGFIIGTGKANARLVDSGGTKNTPITDANSDYTVDTFRSAVMRWDGTSLYMKLGGAAGWNTVTCGNLADLTGTLRFNGDGSASINGGCYRLVMFKTQSESAGDLLLNALTELIAA